MKKWIVGGIIAIALALPAAVTAHQGHVHKVLGTVAGIHVGYRTYSGISRG